MELHLANGLSIKNSELDICDNDDDGDNDNHDNKQLLDEVEHDIMKYRS